MDSGSDTFDRSKFDWFMIPLVLHLDYTLKSKVLELKFKGLKSISCIELHAEIVYLNEFRR